MTELSVNKKYTTAVVGNLQALSVLAPAIRAMPEFELVAICCRNQTVAQEAADRYYVTCCHSGWEPLLAERDIEIVALALPAQLQAEAAVKLARAGKHLFCEKPLAANLTDARAICDAVSTNRRHAVVNFGFRMIDAFRDFHSIVRSGMLGAPKMIVGEWLLSNRSNPALTWNWKSDARLGGGTLNLMGSHVLDYLAWFFGTITNVRLQAATLVPFRKDEAMGSPKKVEAEDTCNLLLEVSGGVPACIAISTALPVAQSHRLRVWFTNGLLELGNTPGCDYQDGFKLVFHPAKGADPALATAVKDAARLSHMEPSFPGKVEITRRVMAEFALMLAGRENHAPDLASALQVQACIDLARASASRFSA